MNSTATARPAWNTMVMAALTAASASSGVSARRQYVHGLQHLLRGPAHGELPRVALAEVAAHGHQRQEREAAAAGQRQHVDAVAGAAALHQQHAAGAAEIGAGEQRHALLLGGQRHGVDIGIGERAVDQDAVARVRHVGELRDLVLAQEVVDLVLPARFRAASLLMSRPAPVPPVQVHPGPAQMRPAMYRSLSHLEPRRASLHQTAKGD